MMLKVKTPLIILCGGKGTRIIESIGRKAKILAPVGGYLFIEILINHYKKLGFENIFFSTGYYSDSIHDFVKSQHIPDCNLKLLHETNELGTGGAVKEAFKKLDSDFLYIVNGDSILQTKLKNYESFFNSNENQIVVTSISNADRYGSVKIDDFGKIKDMQRGINNGTNLINAGFYKLRAKDFFSNDINDVMYKNSKFSIEDVVFRRLIDQRKLYGKNISGYFIDMGTAEAYVDLQNNIQNIIGYNYE